jgi:hypothetical protein
VQDLDDHLALEERLFPTIHGCPAALSDLLAEDEVAQGAPGKIAVWHRAGSSGTR